MKRNFIVVGLVMICSVTIALFVNDYTNIAAETSAQEESIICGGFAGISCPEGYYCDYFRTDVTDAQGVCKKINYCHDPKADEEWTRYFQSAPYNDTVIQLFALRTGLCQMVDAGMISPERATDILEQEKRVKTAPKQQ